MGDPKTTRRQVLINVPKVNKKITLTLGSFWGEKTRVVWIECPGCGNPIVPAKNALQVESSDPLIISGSTHCPDCQEPFRIQHDQLHYCNGRG